MLRTVEAIIDEQGNVRLIGNHPTWCRTPRAGDNFRRRTNRGDTGNYFAK